VTRDGLSIYSVSSKAQTDLVRPPWPDGVVYHGSRLLLAVALAVTITGLFPPMGGSTLGRFEEGMVLPDAVIAQVPFTIPKSTAELQRERADAAAGVPPTFNYRPEAGDTMVVRIGRFFARLDPVASVRDSVPSVGNSETLRADLLEASIVVTPQQAVLLMDQATRRLLRNASTLGVRRYSTIGVVDATQSRELTLDRVLIQDPGANSRRSEATENILIGGDLPARIVRDLPTTSPELSELLRLIIISHTVYSLEFDSEVTAADREQVRRAVPESVGNVVQQEAIVRANEPITEADLTRLNAYEAELRRLQLLEEPGLQFGLLLGAFLLNLSLVAVFGALVFFLRPVIYGSLRWLVLMAALVVIYFIVARVIASNDLAPEALPIAFVVLAMAVLWDSRVALVMGLVLSGLTVAQPAFADTDVLFPLMVGGAAAAMSVRVVRRRAQTWVFVAIITGAYAVTLLALSLVGERSAADFAVSMAWAGSNAALSAIIAMGFVPVFEWFTGVTTDQTLLEWADPNAPLLRRLSLEAPGTYAHTINVANLAEMAANAVGAHGLLCRVGLYYHDVGKVLKPHYFVENQVEGRNPHDKLKPDTSSAILIEHVVEGLRLGKEARLPGVIQRFISEHHGTQLIAFFYSRAQEQLGEGNVDEAEYRYPGPKPQSKETAVAMMADSIESATRVLQEPTPERVRDLVEGIIESKQQDGQLDQAPLTMREITVLKDTFVKVLSGIYHHRIDYPTTKHLTDAPDEALKGESGSTQESGSESEQVPVGSGASEDLGRSGEGEPEAVSEQMDLGDVSRS
jgi:putative nucleotidyltransferase with HDIG domain